MDSKKNEKEKAHVIVSALVDSLKKEKLKPLLPEISALLKQVVAGQVQTGEAVTAIPVSKEKIAELEKMLFDKFHHKITLTNNVDPRILGGMVIRIGDMVIDESVKTKLESVAQTIYGS